MTRDIFLNKLKSVDTTSVDWAYNLIDSIKNDYARGKLESYLNKYNEAGGEMNDNLKELLKETSYYFKWD
jgi:hypothetical protein